MDGRSTLIQLGNRDPAATAKAASGETPSGDASECSSDASEPSDRDARCLCHREYRCCCGCCGPRVACWKLCGGCCGATYAAVGVLVFFVHHFIFFPGFALQDDGWRPSRTEEFNFTSDLDGVTLGGMVTSLLDPPAEGSVPVLFFGGNGCLMYDSAYIAGDLLRAALAAGRPGGAAGIESFVSSYRGYAPNGGWASRRALTADAASLRDHASRSGRVILVGWSLGTAVALQLAAASPERVAAVLLLAPFSSMEAVTRSYILTFAGAFGLAAVFPWLWCMNLDPWDSQGAAASLPGEIPVAVVSGEEDEMIPPSQHEAVFGASRGPKVLLRVPHAGHASFQRMIYAIQDADAAAQGSMAEWTRLTLSRAVRVPPHGGPA